MSAPIFISYSSKDQDIAETIYRALEARGHTCWIACRDVRPGENYQEAIVQALRGARVMLLVFTSNANNSDEIKKELVLAGRHRITVVPVRVEDVVPNDAFTYELATRQWIDLFKDWERQIGILAARLGDILQSATPGEAGATAAAAALPLRPAGARPASNQPLFWGAVLAAVVIAVGGGALYLRPGASPAPVAAPPAAAPPAAPPAAPAAAQMAPPAPSPPVKMAAQPPPSSPPPQVAPAPTPATPATPVVSPPPDADEAAWQTASAAGTHEAFGGYLKAFPAGAHAQDAQLRLADAILADTPTSKNFDGRWTTTWTCTNFGRFPGYSYRFAGQVTDGAYHGLKGVKGQPSSLDLNGKIEPDGTAAFYGEIIVGSSLVGLGAARGTPSDFHALARFDRASAAGNRLEDRPCTLSFQKQ